MNQTATADLLDRVERVAKGVRRRYGLEGDTSEMMGEGFLGLAEAESRHDAEQGTGLWTFAFARVRGRMLEHVRNEARRCRLEHPALRYDEAEWESDHDSHVGVVNPGMARCDASGETQSMRSMESCVTQRHLAVLAARLLGDLPKDHRHVVTEVLLHQTPLIDVARSMGKPVWQVRTILNRSMRNMKRTLTFEGYSLADLFGR